MIHIAITDDDSLVLNLLKDFLDKQENIQVSFTAESGKKCIEILQQISPKLFPEVLLLDLNMDEMNGVETLQMINIHFPSIKTIIFSSHYNSSFVGFMLKNGVSAFIPKGITPKKMVSIIEDVYQKGYFFLDEQMAVIRQQLNSPTPKVLDKEHNLLSERELEVLQMICQQKTAKEIGELLFITKRTVEGHKNTLFAKTGAKNIAGLVIFAVKNGYIDTDNLPYL